MPNLPSSQSYPVSPYVSNQYREAPQSKKCSFVDENEDLSALGASRAGQLLTE